PQFVCRTPECHLGSFEPERGSFCVYTWGEREFRGLSFSLLLNPGGFEALDWLDASFGDAPEGAVQPCPPSDSFVGRSRDGLGKVSRELQALFVSVEGEEVWYKWYQVLAVRQRPAEVSVTNVTYNGSAAVERAESAALA
ncbi:NATT3 protein, partial [Malurus elegans]|nr:NATT3 protein [Malurus elegans]